MILMADDRWEVKNPFLLAMDDEHTHRYWMIELGLYVPIFVVEVMVNIGDDDDGLMGRIFYLTEFSEVLPIINEEWVKKHKISYLTPRYSDTGESFSVSQILKCTLATTSTGSKTKIFSCANGKEYSYPGGSEDESIIDTTDIYTYSVG